MVAVTATRQADAKCWARPLGDCSGDITREHTISAGVLASRTVSVQGLPWCRDEPKVVGVPSLVAKRLCKGHNEGLSECDLEAKRLFDVMDAAVLLDDERRKRPPREWLSNVVTHHISGHLLERWLLKTLINMTVDSGKLIGDGATDAGVIDPELVAVAFGRAAFSPPRGLYGGAIVGETVDGTREWEFHLLGGDRVTGLLARLRTLRFGLSLIPHRLPRVIEHVEDWKGTQLIQPFNGINKNLGPFPSQRIVFDW